MARRAQKVTFEMRSINDLPEAASEAALLGRRLVAAGVFEEAERRMPMHRGAGYGVRSLLAGLLLMWSTGGTQSSSCRLAATCERAIAACFGLVGWFVQSSMSRVLAAVSASLVGDFTDWLLSYDCLPCTVLESGERDLHRDARGKAWLIGDADGRVNAMRQRALPDDDDSPPARRRVLELAAPGYPGRKRGEVQEFDMIVQLLGSGRYLGLRNGPGGGDHPEDVRWAFGRVAAAAGARNHPLERTMVRLDGKAVGPATIEAAYEAGVIPLARWSDYSIFERVEVRESLASATWTPVPDSGSGPRRTAAELCTRDLSVFGPASGDGQESSVTLPLRFVVSRFPAPDGQKRGAGCVRDGHQYELFATLCEARDWPAAELVTLYYGRCGQENRFLQTDQSIGKLRAVCQRPAGQQLALAVALLLWNLRTVVGFDAAGDGAPPPPEQELRAGAVPCEAAQQATTTVPEAPTEVTPEAAPEAAAGATTRSATAEPAPSMPSEADDVSLFSDTPACEQDVSFDDVVAKIVALRRDQVTASHPGWTWEESRGCWLCSGGASISVRALRRTPLGVDLRFRSAKTACRRCSARDTCTNSPSHDFRKEITLHVGAEELPQLRLDPSRMPARNKSTCPRKPSPTARKRPPNLRAYHLPPSDRPGPYLTAAPCLVPSYYRNLVVSLLRTVTVRVDPPAPQPRPRPRHPGHAATAAERQHRRLTFAQARARHVIPRERLPALHLAYPRGASLALLMRICG